MVTITVTNKDIREGRPMNAGACPIARAAQREFPDCQVLVGGYINVVRKGLHTNYELPPEASSFVRLFDAGMPVKPITFEV